MIIDDRVRAAFTPTGTLRASIHLGNPILAGTDPATGAATGVSVDLAREPERGLRCPGPAQFLNTSRRVPLGERGRDRPGSRAGQPPRDADMTMGTLHWLEPDGRTLRGHFSRDFPPVLTVEPGDSVRLATLDAWWSRGPFTGGSFPDRPRSVHHDPSYGHALVGPIEIRGARPGMTLEVHIDAVVPASWGTCVAGGWPSSINQRYGILEDGVVHTWQLDPDTMTGRNQHGHTVTLRPFLGIMGMPPPEPGQHSTIPPRRHGGNLDCKELIAGSTLYLPIPVEGALFSTGDGHAAQGDGEVSGTAIECPMDRVELRFGLREDLPVTTPLAQTPAGWLTIGLGATLDEASFDALEAMFGLLHRLYRVSRCDAIALASVAVDLRVTQIVNQIVGVHAVLRPDAIRTAGPAHDQRAPL